MKTVVLCGGQGTRIRDANELLPKPMLPIGGMPVLWHIMKTYAAYGFHDFVLCLGYKGWTIKEFFLNYRAMRSDFTVVLGSPHSVAFRDADDVEHDERDWRVTLADTGEDTQTAGRIAAVQRYLSEEDLFLLTYGDGVADVRLDELVAFHRGHGRIATVTAVRPPGRFGELQLTGDRVTEFNEKPQATEGYINGGFFVIDARRVWPYLVDSKAVAFEREPLRALARDGELVAFRHDGFWQPMDTYREYVQLNEMWTQGRAPWKIW
jgi:glucose-1-phosphate cytidylyltransferase